MTVATVITTLCLAGVVFNVRFLLALFIERKVLSNETTKHREEKKQVVRAA